MKKLSALILTMFLLLPCFYRPVSAAIPPVNVVRVFVEDQGNEQSAGTGTLIRSDLILTNNHVVKNRVGVVRVLFPDWSVYKAKVVKTDPRWDLAALRIESVFLPPVKLGKNPKIGDLIVVGGYGSGWYETDSGKMLGFCSIVKNSPDDAIRIDAKVRSGDSGGPMLSNGKLVGVIFGYSDSTYGIGIKRVRAFLEGVK